MATYLYDDGELVEYTLGDDLNPPVRSLFLISDEETIFDVTIEFTDDEIIDVTLPLIASLNGKHYYSLPRKLFNFIELFFKEPFFFTNTAFTIVCNYLIISV